MVRIRAVTPLDDFRVRLVFTDGSEREIDLDPYLHGPVFEPLRQDRSAFLALQVDPNLGTIIWPNGADICPDVLYGSLTPAAWEEPAAAQASGTVGELVGILSGRPIDLSVEARARYLARKKGGE